MRVAKVPSRALVAGIAAVWTALWYMTPPPVVADGGEYDYAVERVIIDGNVWGPHDGTADAVEETFDPRINQYGLPNPPYGFAIPFDSFLGNSSPIDGALHLFSPGTLVDFPWLGYRVIQSDVLSASPVLRDGAGDARIQVDFQAATIALNQYVHSTFVLVGPLPGASYASLAFANFDADMALRQVNQAIPGLSMFAQLVDASVRPLRGQSIPVEPSLAGGPFSIAFDYDDTAKTITPTYSLDGGATFAGGFDPFPLPFDGSGTGWAKLMLGADPRETEDPNACPTGSYRRLSHHRVVAKARRDENVVTFRAQGLIDSAAGPFNPVAEGAQITILDRGTATNLVAVTVPPVALGAGCDPRDGWSASGSGFIYRNFSNAVPPGCAAGSASGVTLMKVKAGSTPYRITISGTVSVPTRPASVIGPLFTTFIRGQGGDTTDTGACLALQSNDAPCKIGTRAAHCQS